MKRKIKVFEAFSGYGSQAMAAKRLQRDFPDDVEFEFVGTSEIEPAAIKAYEAVHGETRNYGDISKVNWAEVPYFDLLTYSFPCTDISNAGRQAGFSEGSGTRSSLLWECEKVIRDKRPPYLLMENVKALVQKKFMPDFRRWTAMLEGYGYVNFWKVLNAKDFGVAQNRERVFMVSILRTEDAPDPTYTFPQGFPLDKCVEDYMVDAEEIGEDYFIDRERVTDKVLSDILDQPNVRAQMEELYHKEWKERGIESGRDEEILFISAEWIRREDGCGNMANHWDVFDVVFERGGKRFKKEIKIDVWYVPMNGIAKRVKASVPFEIANYEKYENAIIHALKEHNSGAN